MGDFDVFDEWGNFVGRFTPAGAGAGAGCLFLIALIPVLFLGFFIFMFIKGMIKLITEGYEAAKKREWRKAVVCFGTAAIPFILLFVIAASTVTVSVAKSIAQEQERALQEQRAQQELRNIKEHFPVSISNVRRMNSSKLEAWFCPKGPGDCHDVYVLYAVKNEWRGSIDLLEEGEGSWPDGSHIIGCFDYWRSSPSAGRVEANSTRELSCTDFTTLEKNGRLVIATGYTKPLERLCINVELTVDYDGLYQYTEVIKRHICTDIPYGLSGP